MTQITIKRFGNNIMVQKWDGRKTTTLHKSHLPDLAAECARKEIAKLNRLGLKVKVNNRVSCIEL